MGVWDEQEKEGNCMRVGFCFIILTVDCIEIEVMG